MPVNHAKEFLKYVHNEALFSHLFSRTLIEVRSLNFKAKDLKMAKINSEFLNVSMVEPAPESATTLVSLMFNGQMQCTKFYEKQQIVSNSLFAAHFDVRFAYLAEIGSF